MNLYAVIDRRAKHIVAIFPALNDEAAERSFLMLLTGPKNIYTDFPEDFDLYPVADLSFDKGSLFVSAHGYEELQKHGFKVDCFSVPEAIKYGADYDKRYLSMLHADRFPDLTISPESEVSSDVECN